MTDATTEVTKRCYCCGEHKKLSEYQPSRIARRDWCCRRCNTRKKISSRKEEQLNE